MGNIQSANSGDPGISTVPLDRQAHPSLASPQALASPVAPTSTRWFFGPLKGPDISATYAEYDASIHAVRSGSASEIERAVSANGLNGGARLAEVIERVDARMLTGSGRHGRRSIGQWRQEALESSHLLSVS
ncbi:hypothetical protein BH11GEM2_BH11GEM2_14420 [soil metagenome]